MNIQKNKFTVISTFSGCGGSSLGYKLAGGRVLLAVEFDDDAIKTYKMNFPDTPIYEGDICKLSVAEVLERTGVKVGELDILDGSPPCQGFSSAGKRKFNDERNDLFKEFARLVDGLQPKVFVMENVSGMIKGKMKLKFKEIVTSLRQLGYETQVKLMNAKYYNVPQSRERLVFIGVRNDLNITPQFPLPNSNIITLKEAFINVPDYEDRPMKDDVRAVIAAMSKPFMATTEKRKLLLKIRGRPAGFIGLILLDYNKPCCTIPKSEIDITGLVHPKRHRYLNIDELKICGSFPLSFKFTSRKNANARIGNAVCPNMMKAIASCIYDNILSKAQ